MTHPSINRTATFAWSPREGPSVPKIATGTVAGALDASFSNASTLEVWAPRWGGSGRDNGEGHGTDKEPIVGKVDMDAKFNRLAWGYVSRDRKDGIIAAGLENGSVDFWDAAKIKAPSVIREEAILHKETNHTGPVKGLDFNQSQTNLIASGASKGEIFVWDLNNPSKPYSPGERSTRLDDVTALAWNNAQAPHILASGSSNGQVVVWHLVNKREVLTISHPTSSSSGLGGKGLGGSSGGGISAVCWNPESSTQLITASEDDSAICVWDLRNARAPERVLRGHEKGVLSLAWCRQDSNLLLSSGKDSRTLCWDMSASSVVGELPSTSNWTYQVEWCPLNPNIFATASFDGKLTIQPLQHTGEDPSAIAAQAAAASATGADLFEQSNLAMTAGAGQGQGIKLSTAPKWLKRPAGASWGFPGCLVTSSLSSKVIKLQNMVTESGLVARVKELEQAIDGSSLKEFTQKREAAMTNKPVATESKNGMEPSSAPLTRAQVQDWTLLSALYQADSRDQLVNLLGFSKSDIVHELEGKLKKMQVEPITGVETPGRSPLDAMGGSPVAASLDGKVTENSEVASVNGNESLADTSNAEPSQIADSEKTTEDAVRAHVSTNNGIVDSPMFAEVSENDPFANLHHHRTLTDRLRGRGEPSSMSIAATAGESGPPSVTSASMKSSFKIYPKDGSDTDKLITRAIIMGDYESAVSLCLHEDRPADALIMAGCGGPDLLKRTREAYIEKKTQNFPYLRLLQNILSNDLEDVVQSADLDEWQEIFVILCTFAKTDEFSDLAEALGMRIEYQYTQSNTSSNQSASKLLELRQNAVLCFLAAGKLERIIGVWIEEMQEEEKKMSSTLGSKTAYDAHVHALQNLIEKVTVFQHASGYVDNDFDMQREALGERQYKLSALYDKYLEYAEILGNQGLVKSALRFVNQVPQEYKTASELIPGTTQENDTAAIVRDRLVQAAGKLPKTPVLGTTKQDNAASRPLDRVQPQSNGYVPSYGVEQHRQPDGYQPPQQQLQPPSTDYYPQSISQNDPYAPGPIDSTSMAPMPTMKATVPEPTPFAAYDYSVPQGQNTTAFNQPYQPYQPAPMAQGRVAPPPPLPAQTTSRPKPTTAWNDVPALNVAQPQKRSTASPAPILSPFPNAPMSTSYSNAPIGQMAPPMRGPTPGSIPPPPPSSQRMAIPPPPPGGRLPQAPGQPSVNNQQAMGMQRPGGMPMQSQGRQDHYGPPPPQAGQPGPRPVQYGNQGATGMVPPPRAGSIPPPSPMSQPPMTLPGQSPGSYGPPPQQRQMSQGPPSISSTLPPQRQPQQPLPPPPHASSQGYGPPPARGPTSTPPIGRGPPSSTTTSPFPPPANRSITPTIGPGGGPRSTPASVTSPAGSTGGQPSRYPPGDRTHMPTAARPIYSVLTAEIRRARQHATTPQMKRGVDDTEKRLNFLFDALNAESVSPDIIQDLTSISKAIESRDYQKAVQLQTELHANKSDLVRSWIIGLKQLISLARMIPQ